MPACKRHNEDFSKLDERVRVYIQGTSTDPLAVELFNEDTARGLTRPEYPGLLRSLANASTPARLNDEETYAISIAPDDITTFGEKLFRALYFCHHLIPFSGSVMTLCSHINAPGQD